MIFVQSANPIKLSMSDGNLIKTVISCTKVTVSLPPPFLLSKNRRALALKKEGLQEDGNGGSTIT